MSQSYEQREARTQRMAITGQLLPDCVTMQISNNYHDIFRKDKMNRSMKMKTMLLTVIDLYLQDTGDG